MNKNSSDFIVMLSSFAIVYVVFYFIYSEEHYALIKTICDNIYLDTLDRKGGPLTREQLIDVWKYLDDPVMRIRCSVVIFFSDQYNYILVSYFFFLIRYFDLLGLNNPLRRCTSFSFLWRLLLITLSYYIIFKIIIYIVLFLV